VVSTTFWHPFASMGSVRDRELVIERGEGLWVWDAEGRRYLDATASLWYANVGHGRKEIADAIAAQLRSLETYMTFADFANRPALDLAERLCSASPVADPRVFLGSGGGDAIETAAKLSRRYFNAVDQPDRVHLIGRTAGYHGTHGHGTAIGGIAANRESMGPLDDDVSQVRHDSVDALRAEMERIGPERVAAFFLEPVIGAGGVYPPAEGYIEAVGELCRANGILLVVDSVICGFGRLGTWFGIERWGVEPDMVCFAKGVTSGYLPLGGVVVSGRVGAPFWDSPDAPMFRHGPTYAGHATCCAAALANMDILEREGLLARGMELEGALFAALRPLSEHALIDEVRGGIGTLAALQLNTELLEQRPSMTTELAALVRDGGVLIRPLGGCVAVSPPLTATREHFATIAEAIADGLEALEERRLDDELLPADRPA
jgi:putrescine---pyruvate transaminase